MKMRNWYGPPIPVAGIPGRVYACAGGDFCGPIYGGYFGNLLEFSASRVRNFLRVAARPQYQLNAGFASLEALINDVKYGGLGQKFNFYKNGVTQPSPSSSAWLFHQGAVPIQRAAPGSVATTPGGTVYTNTSLGGFSTISDAGTNTTFFISGAGVGNQTSANGALMLVDYLWDANVQYNVTNNPITGVPTRYQTATTAPGNFMSGDTTVVLGATAANLTVTYVDQGGNAPEAMATVLPIRINSAVGTIPHAPPIWFVNLNAGDTGLRNATNIAFSAGNGGYVARMIAHPLAIIPINQGGATTGQAWSVIDGVNSAFQFERVYNGACLALMEFYKGGTGATSYTGTIMLASG